MPCPPGGWVQAGRTHRARWRSSVMDSRWRSVSPLAMTKKSRQILHARRSGGRRQSPTCLRHRPPPRRRSPRSWVFFTPGSSHEWLASPAIIGSPRPVIPVGAADRSRGVSLGRMTADRNNRQRVVDRYERGRGLLGHGGLLAQCF